MLVSLLAFPPHFAAQLLEQPFVADNQERLRRRFQQIEKCPGLGSRVDVMSVGEKLHRAAAAGRFEQTLAELLPQDSQQLVELVDREPAAPKIRKHQE